MPSIPSRKKALAIAVRNYIKAEIKVFSSCPNLLDFFTLLIAMNLGTAGSLAVKSKTSLRQSHIDNVLRILQLNNTVHIEI